MNTKRIIGRKLVVVVANPYERYSVRNEDSKIMDMEVVDCEGIPMARVVLDARQGVIERFFPLHKLDSFTMEAIDDAGASDRG